LAIQLAATSSREDLLASEKERARSGHLILFNLVVILYIIIIIVIISSRRPPLTPPFFLNEMRQIAEVSGRCGYRGPTPFQNP